MQSALDLKRPLFLVNPFAGRGKTGRVWPTLKASIEGALGPIDVCYTDKPGAGISLAKAASEQGRRLIVAVGGDGTFHEVVNGVASAAPWSAPSEHGALRADVGLLAQGTGGDFRRTLGIEHRLDRYLEALKSGRRRPLDLGRATFTGVDGATTERWFVNVLSAGMGGLVDRYVAESGRALGNAAAYWMASFRALMNIEPGRVRVTVTPPSGPDETHELSSYMVAFCNGRFFGSGMEVAPMADPSDGILELVAMPAGSKVAFTMRSQSIYKGTHIGDGRTTHLRGKKFRVELVNERAASTFLLDVDGEPLGRLPLEIEVVPSRVHVRA